MPIAETVNSYLSDRHVKFDLVPHRKSDSCLDSAIAAHVQEDHVAKAVIVKDNVGYAMIIIPASSWIKMHAFQKEIGHEYNLAREDELNNLFKDCRPGAIPALGPAYGIETFLDEQLMTLANIYFEAGDHENLIHVHGNEFHELLKGVRHGHFCSSH